MGSEKFEPLRKELSKGQVLLPGDDGFEASLYRWSTTCIKPAAAVAKPATVEEVSAVVKFATANKIAFNVKCGGHSTAQNSSAPSPEGMVLDLGLIQDVSVDKEAMTITFGGGCLWHHVDDALGPHGLGTVGGTVSHTGVGGLILHGGFGVLTGLHGLTVDVLVSCEVVLADGSIVTASETENSDLFWALRGAGSSFGVVTQFTSRVFPQGNIWGGPVVWSIEQLPQVVDFINHWYRTNKGEEPMAIGIGRAPLGPDQEPGSPRPMIIMSQLVHAGPNAPEDGPKYYEALLKLPALVKDVDVKPYTAINKTSDEALAPGTRYLMGGSNYTVPLTLESVVDIKDKFEAFTTENPDTMDSFIVWECIPHPRVPVPQHATAFNNRGEYHNVCTTWKWYDESLDQKIRDFNHQLQKDIRKYGYDDENFKDGVGLYLNYASADGITAETAFGSNADRLRALKKKYDPQNVFNKLWKLIGEGEEKLVV